MPDQVMGEELGLPHKVAQAAGGMIGDLPASIGGFLAGNATGLPVVGMAGAVAVPMAIRDALVEAYNNDHAMNWSGVWEIAKAGLKGGGKGAVIGAATGGAGVVAGKALGGVASAGARMSLR
jgi:hypothetical protein